jgi:ketosteroid isomerase-like protein
MPSSETPSIQQVGAALFDAIERGDAAAVAALFHPGIGVWHAGDRRDNDYARAVRVIEWFIDSTTERSYEILDRQLFETGFVQQHILRATGIAGAVISLRVCIVIKVDAAGLITRIDEYFDPADMAALMV